VSDEQPRRRYLRPGEILAIREEAIQKDDRGAFFFLFGPSARANERFGDISVVNVRGALDYHDDGWGESYEAIVRRVESAISGEDVVQQWRRTRWSREEEGEEPAKVPPKSIVLRIDSPGGVVAGLDQTINRLRALSKDSGIPLLAYVDEQAYSAAFALSCACAQIVLPRAGMLGSIGVISTMVDMTRADRKAGLRFVVLTSGARKADGHPHVPITDAMIAAERPRVAQLARQFFGVVRRARGIPIATIQGWEAARFMGREATTAGLADAILSWDELLATAQTQEKKVASPGTRVPTSTNPPKASTMTIEIDALITRTTAAIASEKEPAKLAKLAASLEAYKKTKHSIEKHETEEGEEDGEEEEEEEESGDETDRDEEDDGEEDDDSDDDDGEGAESDEEEKKAAVASIVRASGMTKGSGRKAFRSAVEKAIGGFAGRSGGASAVMRVAAELTGKSRPGAIVSALRGLAEGATSMKTRLAALEQDNRATQKASAIDAALAANRITKREARDLRGKKLSFVEEFLKFRPGAVVQTRESAEREPAGPVRTRTGAVLPGQDGTLPADLEKIVQSALAAAKAQGLKSVTRDTILAGLTGAASTATPEV